MFLGDSLDGIHNSEDFGEVGGREFGDACAAIRCFKLVRRGLQDVSWIGIRSDRRRITHHLASDQTPRKGAVGNNLHAKLTCGFEKIARGVGW